VIAHVMSVGLAAQPPGELPMLALDVAVKAGVLLGAAALVSAAFRRKSAAVRHLVWSVAVIGVLLLPLIAGVVPRIPVAVLGGGARTEALLAPLESRAGMDGVIRFSAPKAWALPADARVEHAGAPAEHLATSAERMLAPVSSQDAQSGQFSTLEQDRALWAEANPSGEPVRAPWWVVLAMVWGTGVLVVGARLAGEYLRAWRYARRAVVVRDARLLERVDAYAAAIGLARVPRVIEGDAFVMPMTWGLLRPVLLLPSGAAGWSAQRLRAVVLHELAHIRRRDAWTQLAVQFVCTLHWFNPLAWLAAKRMNVEREHACDDIVLSAGERPSAYAGELLELVRKLRPSRPVAQAAIAMARRSQLKDRLSAVLDEDRNRAEPSIALAFRFAAVGAALLIPLAALHPVRSADAMQVAEWEHPPAPPARLGAAVFAWAPVDTPPRPPAPPPAAVPRAPVPFEYDAPPTPPAVPAPPGSGAPAAPPAPPSALRGSAGVAPAVAAWGHRADAQERCGSRARNTSVSNSSNSAGQRYAMTWRSGGCSGAVRMNGAVRFSGDFSAVTSISSGGQLVIEEDDGRDERRVVVRPAGSGLSYDYELNGRKAEYDSNAKAWFQEVVQRLFRTTGFAASERVEYLLQNGGPERVFDAVREIESDHVKRVYLEKLLDRGDLPTSLVKGSLDIAGSDLKSDYETAQLLIGTADRHALNAEARGSYLRAASTIHSDYEKRRVLDRLLKSGNGAGDLIAVIREAVTIRSDYEKAQLLVAASSKDVSDAALQLAYVEAAGTIASDYEHRRALLALLKNTRLSAAGLERLLNDAPKKIGSDYELAQVLAYIAEKQPLTGEQKAAFRKAMDSIASRYEYGRVASALLKHQG